MVFERDIRVPLIFFGAPGRAPVLGGGKEVRGRQIFRQRATVRQKAAELADCEVVVHDVMAEDDCVSLLGRSNPSSIRSVCGLPGAVLAHEAEDLAGLHLERNIVHSEGLAEHLAQPIA